MIQQYSDGQTHSRLTNLLSKTVSLIVTGVAVAGVTYFGATIPYRLIHMERGQAYHDAVHSVTTIDRLQDFIGSRATRGLEPKEMSSRLNQAQSYVERNLSDFSSFGLSRVNEKILEINDEVAHFLPDWPLNAHVWYSYLNGLPSPDSAFRISREKEKFFSQGGKLQKVNHRLNDVKRPHKDYVDKVHLSEENSITSGIIIGMVILAFGSSFISDRIYKKTKGLADRLFSRH